jgi:hypothetical protein
VIAANYQTATRDGKPKNKRGEPLSPVTLLTLTEATFRHAIQITACRSTATSAVRSTGRLALPLFATSTAIRLSRYASHVFTRKTRKYWGASDCQFNGATTEQIHAVVEKLDATSH